MRRKKKQHRDSFSFSGQGAGRPERHDLVYVHVESNDDTWFSLLLTRVPSVGEFVECDGREFKVTRVLHNAVTPEGVSACGTQAIIDVEIEPEELPSFRRRKAKA